MKNHIKQIALAIITGIIFLTCTNPFFPGTVSHNPNDDAHSNRMTANTYTVTFELGSNDVKLANPSLGDTQPDAEEVFKPLHLTEGAKIPKLPALVRDNYAFGGWYTDNGTWNSPWNFDTPVITDISLFARWEQKSQEHVTVSFKTNVGTQGLEDMFLIQGSLVVEPPPLTKEGYAFNGWYTDTNELWNFNTPVTQDITLSAQWVEVHYTVRFEANGGLPEPVTQNSNSGLIFAPPPMTKTVGDTKYAFGGWFTDNGVWNEPWDFGAKVNSNMTLYAKWAAIPIQYYTVHFDAKGGKPEPADQRIVSGGKVNVPPADMINDVNDFKGFGGWYTDDVTFTNEWRFASDTVTKNITLYAKWVGHPYHTVTFEANGGLTLAGEKPAEQQIADGGKAIRPRPVFRYTYGFDGWYTVNGIDDGTWGDLWDFDSDIVTVDRTLYAKWEKETCVIRYYPDGGSTPPHDEVTVAKGGKAVMPRPMSKDGYFFGGWYRDNGVWKQPWDFDNDTVDVDTDLYAKWIEIYYTVTFNRDGGTPAPAQQIIVHDGKAVMPLPMSKTGNAFVGWYKDPGFTDVWNFDTDTVTGNITLYANWVTSVYTVTFAANGGSPAPAPQNVTNGGNAAMPPPMSKAGLAFAGWFKDSSFANVWNFDNDTVTGNITLYANWVVPPTYYTVTFNTNSSIPAPIQQTIIEGGKITEPLGTAMRQPGYSFRGWFTEDQSLWNFAADQVTQNVTLHAEWSIIYYTVLFNMGIIDSYTNQDIIYGGGDQNPESQSVAYGGKIIEPLDMTRDSMAIVDGYGFDGWWLWADSSAYKGNAVPAEWNFEDNTVGPDYTTTGATNINLYPRWIKDQKYLEYTSTNASGSSDLINNGNLVWVRKGNFTMGNQSVSGARPEHQVTLTNGFFMGMYPVTRDQYQNVMNDDPSSNKIDWNLPASNVTWLDAIMFCNELTKRENNAKGAGLQEVYYIDESSIVLADGSKWPPVSSKTIISAAVKINWNANGYRLPTEAEWEYAARGGKGSPGNYEWAGSNTASEVAWFSGTGGNSGGKTHPVGLLKPNILRTFDMSGNVCEWCWDEFASGYYTTSSPSITDPKGPGFSDTVVINNPGKDTPRVRRGGSWNHGINNTRTFIRDSFQPTDINMQNYWTIGFRVVRGPLQ